MGRDTLGFQIVYVLTNLAMPGFVKIGKTLHRSLPPAHLSRLMQLLHARRIMQLRLSDGWNGLFSNVRLEQAIANIRLLHVAETTAEVTNMPTTYQMTKRGTSSANR